MDFVDTREAGDLAVNFNQNREKDSEIRKGSYEKISRHQKLNKSLVCRHPLMSLSNCASPSIIDKGFYNYVALIQNNVIRMENDVTPCRIDYCGFPYYRSCRANNSSHDCVLMKDAAVSCTLLEPKSSQDNLTLSAIEDYLLKQIKTEYQDLSEMTKKISTYTKDKLQNISKKYKRRKSDLINDLKKKPVATEYIDENGILCLKLRLEDIDETEMKESAVKNIVSTLINSWNFLTSPQQQQKRVNKRDEKKKMVVKSARESCSCIYKDIYKIDKRMESGPEIDRLSHIYLREHNKSSSRKFCNVKRECCSFHNGSKNSVFKTNNKIRPLDINIKRDKSFKNRNPIKIEKWRTECATAILNDPNKKMKTINIQIIERHREDS